MQVNKMMQCALFYCGLLHPVKIDFILVLLHFTVNRYMIDVQCKSHYMMKIIFRLNLAEAKHAYIIRNNFHFILLNHAVSEYAKQNFAFTVMQLPEL